METPERDALCAAFILLHHCHARFTHEEHVRVALNGTNFEPTVAVFELAGAGLAEVAYAWSVPDESHQTVRHHVMLGGGPVRTPYDAVRIHFLLHGTGGGVTD